MSLSSLAQLGRQFLEGYLIVRCSIEFLLAVCDDIGQPCLVQKRGVELGFGCVYFRYDASDWLIE